MEYEVKKFDLPELDGISAKQVEVHLGLYAGYVKHTNVLREQIAELSALDAEKYAYAIAEIRRRLGFEFNGMRMHELYFSQFEGGAKDASDDSALVAAVSEKYGSWDDFITHFKSVGMSRGIGWTILYQDPIGGTMHTAWVTDHELGQLGSLPVILAMDMWEHAFMVDYVPAEKKNYVEAFLKNVNWSVVEGRMV
ncbi:superoxide dismutase [Candidatus Parcubacteria bacterium]|uniref:superoxide dismutase n=1 Tax=Candidatus Kaiserbacteria bacterium CG10_big_fil_rev_8_21_14_0_10_47_16 TaxID=1974608 RepID=A0A2H0UDS8_9BACT|nr:superoxide dismutase [Candidatus Parcubacteria bacterium]PIR84552.1 MAG: superoxide dismutase [Candidatus Kaiserbacteria bacterium CG10_big_fil_rev_8_21_14_0_10_47_16]